MKKTLVFTEKVLEVVRSIPRGSVLTYKQVAVQSGSPGAARVVGLIMKKNYRLDVPCHRVIKSNRTVGQYNRNGGVDSKIKILKSEGVIIKGERVLS